MGTRYMAGELQPDGKVKAIYGQWDGHITSHGINLAKNWTDRANVKELLKNGDVSSLGTNIGEKHSFDDRSKEGTPSYIGCTEKGWTTFYKRDRGETGVGAKTFPNLQTFVSKSKDWDAEYVYLFDLEGRWHVYPHDWDLPIPAKPEEMPLVSFEMAEREIRTRFVPEVHERMLKEAAEKFAGLVSAAV